MILDSHHHFWMYNIAEYDWINDDMRVIRRDFLPPDLENEMKWSGVSGVVSVQARQSLAETEWLLGLAWDYDFIKGVVGWVDLCNENVEEKLVSYTSNTKLVGIRHVLQGEPDDKFMLREDFLRGISLLERYNLTYDILIYPKHLPYATELVKMFPHQKFVLDHLAKPYIKDNVIEPWKSDIEALAANQNVYCKISGMVTEADWTNWKPETFYPYIDTVTGAFGYDRVMVGSDWPVCLVAGSYADVMNIPLKYFENLPADTLNKIKALNCKQFYGLKV